MEKHFEQERERIEQLATMCVCNNLRKASRIVTASYDRFLGQVTDLRVSQAIVLVVLYLAGPQTINMLADRMALDRTTIGRNLRPLAHQGLLTLTPGKDQRTRVVTLTPLGQETLLRLVPQWEQAQAQMVGGMGPQQIAAFLAQLSTAAAVAERTQEP